MSYLKLKNSEMLNKAFIIVMIKYTCEFYVIFNLK